MSDVTPENAEAQLAAQLAAIREERANLKVDREARATPSVEDQIKAETQALAAERALDEAQRKYGAKQVRLVRIPDGAVIVRRPHWVAYRKFQDQKEFTYDATEEFVTGCLVYPDRRAFAKLLEEQPAVLAQIGLACGELAGLRVDELKSK